MPGSVAARARELEVPCYRLGTEFQLKLNDEGTACDWLETQDGHLRVAQRGIPVPGGVSLAAAATAIQALRSAGALIEPRAISAALGQISVPGRLELRRVPGKSQRVLFDVAHNPAAARRLALKIDALRHDRPASKVHLVLAMLADKDINGFVRTLESCVDFWYISGVDGQRAMPSQELKGNVEAVVESHASILAFESVPIAYESAIAAASQRDLVVVTGSFQTVAATRELTQACSDLDEAAASSSRETAI